MLLSNNNNFVFLAVVLVVCFGPKFVEAWRGVGGRGMCGA